MLYALSLYQVISCGIGLIVFISSFLSPQSNVGGLFAYLLAAIFLGIMIYVIYINTEFIRSRKITKRFKTVNQWFSFLQFLTYRPNDSDIYAGINLVPPFASNP